jgi:hypothetical protein
MNTDMIKLFIHKLANIPSGIANAAQQGLGKMQVNSIELIEQLYLHVIELNNELQNLKKIIK